MRTFHARRLTPALLLSGLLAFGLGACNGDNLFVNAPGGGSGSGSGTADTTPPTVDLQFPTSGATLTVGDSVFAQARVADNRALASVTFSGYAVRGDPSLGTADTVAKFTAKTVDLTVAGRAVLDTVVARYLNATADTVAERVVIRALARDTAGNTALDTAVITAQGANAQLPTVQIQFPTDSATVAVSDSVFTQVRVTDGQGIRTVVLEGFALRGDPNLGTQTRVERFAPKTIDLSNLGRAVRDTVLTRYLLATADSVTERQVYIVATATNAAGLSEADTVVIGIGGPRVTITAPAPGATFGAGTVVPVRLSASDRISSIIALRLRGSGAFAFDTTLTLSAPAASVDTAINVQVPNGVSGTLQLDATATSGARIVGTARPVNITITGPVQDVTPPRVSFSVTVPQRAEPTDSFSVAVTGVDETRVDSVGVSMVARFRNNAGRDTTVYLTRRVDAQSSTFRFGLSTLPLATTDTATLRLEVTAFAKDGAGNCGAAVTPNTVQSLPCQSGPAGSITTGSPGALSTIAIVRGLTVGTAARDVLADLKSDGRNVFVSNFDRNRVEVLPITGTSFTTPISVGSQPWGLAVGRNNDTLYVANSGGTNISVVGLVSGLREVRRIETSNMLLYDVAYDVQKDTATSVTPVDYSDRPQFLEQISTGQVLYSTEPTGTRPDGTIRIYDASKNTSDALNRGPEIFTQYASTVKGKAIVVNALSAALAPGGLVTVCPRRVRPTDPDPACFSGFVSRVSARLDTLRAAGETDTRLDLGADITTVGLSDTTFVAVSRNHSTIAFGEGARDPGRIFLFQVGSGGALQGSSVGTTDLVGNAAERVIGLGLNGDGTLGVARGTQVYYFKNNLRLQGVAQSGAPSGGAALDPRNTNYPTDDGYRVSFVSGITTEGLPYIDIIDTYTFRSRRRIFIRDRVTGTLIVVPVAAGDPEAGTLALRLFALTQSGVVRIGLTSADLQ